MKILIQDEISKNGKNLEKGFFELVPGNGESRIELLKINEDSCSSPELQMREKVGVERDRRINEGRFN